ncbi:DUF4349 domain-containing protein [Phytoactinopolyspora alkaliphila]|uniref:DUF4349 domain-containing protein n=1 Tax=Phytoactinopolyspora alkaliphila TaxID=1783498 RepID=A0A6N9YGD7_9ACTN|nr:DUF4349 domain-containing protein [Phytoactinopolyspora alkaliphila]NED94121.1 DUF4349 domain-containing protein [Phytoactinopolyspora alkaliphila]
MKRRTVVAYAAAGAVLFTGACSAVGSDSSGGSDMDRNVAAQEAPDSDDSASSPDGESQGGEEASAARGSAGVITQVPDEALGRSIVYTIGLSITTDDVDEAAAKAASVARSAGGFVADERTTSHSSTLTLRVPTEQHSDAVAELQDLGEVTHRSRSTEDVTQQVVDTKSRISSQRESIARIRTLLGEAEELSDVISIEAELAAREADLDALLSRQEQLSNLTTLATIDVTFRAASAEAEDSEAAVGFLAGLKNGWNAFTDVMGGAATALGAALPFMLLAAVLGVPLWLWLRRRRPSGQHPMAAQPSVPPAA